MLELVKIGCAFGKLGVQNASCTPGWLMLWPEECVDVDVLYVFHSGNKLRNYVCLHECGCLAVTV
jgi:hypothetical protein